ALGVSRLCQWIEARFVVRRVLRLNVSIERQRLVPRRADFDVMGTRCQVQRLERSVELIDLTRVAVIHDHLASVGFDVEPNASHVRVRCAVRTEIGGCTPSIPKWVVPSAVERCDDDTSMATFKPLVFADLTAAVKSPRNTTLGCSRRETRS